MRHKVYLDGHHGTRVPFTEVELTDGSSVRLYDTSGPGSDDPVRGLPPLRRPWIEGRGDVEEYEGRRPTVRDDGRGAARRGQLAPVSGTQPLRAKPGRTVT